MVVKSYELTITCEKDIYLSGWGVHAHLGVSFEQFLWSCLVLLGLLLRDPREASASSSDISFHDGHWNIQRRLSSSIILVVLSSRCPYSRLHRPRFQHQESLPSSPGCVQIARYEAKQLESYLVFTIV